MTDEEKADRAAYMREYRKRNREKYKAIDKAAAEKQRAKNPEKYKTAAKERQRRYRERMKVGETPEQRDRRLSLHRKASQKYAAANKAKIAAKEKRRQLADVEEYRRKAREVAARAYQRDPTRIIGYEHKRRERLQNGAGVTSTEWDGIKALYSHRCAYCQQAGVKLTMDHVKPLSKGGLHEPQNVVPACRPCNAKKGTQEWPRPEPA